METALYQRDTRKHQPMARFVFCVLPAVLLLDVVSAVDVRITGIAGEFANVGILQVRASSNRSEDFGTVCGLNLQAGNVVCKMLGYDFGTVSSSPCNIYGGHNLCGAAGSLVAMQSLQCTGDELELSDCTWRAPDSACQTHNLDSIVYCGHAAIAPFQEGALRLLDQDGAPSIDGIGRLDIVYGGSWAPVCASGFGAGAATVACKAMGFNSAEFLAEPLRCKEKNMCGTIAPSVSSVSCSGSEKHLLDCKHEGGEDVYCSQEEAVVLKCAGNGNAAGRSSKLTAPAQL